MASDYREPLNLGQDRMISINDLADLVADAAGITVDEASRARSAGRPRPQLRQHAAARGARLGAADLARGRPRADLSLDRSARSRESLGNQRAGVCRQVTARATGCPRVDVLGVGGQRDQHGHRARRRSIGWITTGARHYVCVTGVHGVMESQRDETLRRIHNGAGLVTPDGMPLVWLSRSRGWRHTERVYGPDLMLAVLRAIARDRLPALLLRRRRRRRRAAGAAAAAAVSRACRSPAPTRRRSGR